MPRVSQRYAGPPWEAAVAVTSPMRPGDGARALRSASPVGVAAEVVSAAAVPVLGSGAEAVRVAREFADSIAGGAIERDRSGAGPAREPARSRRDAADDGSRRLPAGAAARG